VPSGLTFISSAPGSDVSIMISPTNISYAMLQVGVLTGGLERRNKDSQNAGWSMVKQDLDHNCV